jgi:hypothetical protein
MVRAIRNACRSAVAKYQQYNTAKKALALPLMATAGATALAVELAAGAAHGVGSLLWEVGQIPPLKWIFQCWSLEKGV